MVRRKEAKTTALVLTAIILLIQCFNVPVESVGLYRDSSILGRMLYPFFHGNILHAAINGWCLLSVVFMYDISLTGLLISFVISACPPQCILSQDVYTVGMSGMCFALMGRIAFSVKYRIKYQMHIVSYLLLGFLFPSVNGWLHLYCYIAGLLVGFLNMPIR